MITHTHTLPSTPAVAPQVGVNELVLMLHCIEVAGKMAAGIC